MAAKIHELRAKWESLVKEANAALETVQAKATAENREITAEERAAQDAFDVKIAAAKQAYHDEAKKNERLAELGSAGVPSVVQASTRLRAEDDPARGFASHRDFFLSCIENAGLRDRADVADERLRPLAVFDKDDKQAAGELAFMLPHAFAPASMKAAAGSDEQGGYSDTYGGFSVPTTRAPGLLSVGFEGDPTAGLTENVPMQSPSVEKMARTDKDHTTSVSGGFTVTRRPETGTMSASRMGLEMITMKASSLFGLAYATEEILVDSPLTFAAEIDSGFRAQFGAHILNEKIRGGGGNEYLGVLNSDAAVEIAKESGQGADTIVYDNTIKMRAQCWGYGRAIWLSNHDCYPQLVKLALVIGTSGVAVYQPAPSLDRPDMLHGRPIYYSEFASTVGDVGDLMLVNWSQFLEGTYQPIQGAESVHVRFLNHERTFKLWTRNCGAPWWRAALTPNKSSKKLSPIVTLAERA